MHINFHDTGAVVYFIFIVLFFPILWWSLFIMSLVCFCKEKKRTAFVITNNTTFPGQVNTGYQPQPPVYYQQDPHFDFNHQVRMQQAAYQPPQANINVNMNVPPPQANYGVNVEFGGNQDVNGD